MSEAKKTRKSAKKPPEETESPAPVEASEAAIVPTRPFMQNPDAGKKNDELGEDEAASEPQPVKLTSRKTKLEPLPDSILIKDEEKNDAAPASADAEPAGADSGQVAPEDAPEVPAASNSGESAETPVDNATKTKPHGQEQAEQAPWEDATSGEAPQDDKQQSPAAKQAEAEAAERAKRDETVQQLVGSRRYFLPINAVEQRKSQKFIVAGIGLSLVLVLFWINIALDAGIISLGGIHAATHFFSN